MVDKTRVRRMGARGYELGPACLVLSLGPEPGLAPAKIMRLVRKKGSRW